jgi:hypothetical protein
MALNFFRCEIIQTVYMLNGGFGTGKEVKFITEALLGEMRSHVGKVIAGYCMKRPCHVMSNSKDGGQWSICRICHFFE